MTRKIAILGLLACALMGTPAAGFAAITGFVFSASPASSAPLGTPVTLTVNVTPANAGGTVTFFSGFTDLGGAAVNSSGVASLSVLPPLGSQTLKAVYILGIGQAVTSSATISYNVTAAAGTGFGLVPGTGSGTGANGSTVQADFNNDGKMDIAYINAAGQIIIALGRENGTFTAEAGKPVLAAGTTPTYLAVGDFNGDGNKDLAYTSGGSTGNDIVVYLGNGDGTFGPGGNGKSAETLTVNTQNQLWSGQSFFENSGNFNPLVSLAVGDFNNDGIPDLITTTAVQASDFDFVITDSWWMPQVIVLLGDGAGDFPTQKTSELDAFNFSGPSGNSINSPYGIAIGDFTNDGKADVAISAASQSIGYNGDLAYQGVGAAVTALYLFTGRGDGTFTSSNAPLPSPGGPTNFVAGDFNGDGYLDLAVNNNAGNVEVLLNQAPTSAGSFTLVSTPSYISGGGFGAMATGDFNGDGKLDLAMSAGSGVVSVLGNGNGTFGGPSAVPQVCGSGGAPGGILTADYGSASTADNARDSFLAACTGSEAYAVGLGRAPTATALTATDTTSPATIGETATLTAAVTPNTATGKVTFYSGTKILGTSSLSGGTAQLTDALMPPSTASAGLALLALYEGDASSGVSTGSLSLPVRALPATGFAAAKNTQAGNPQVIVQADFNQDGIPDLAVSDSGDRITILLGNGDGTYAAQSPVLQSAVNAHGMAAVDVNGDGIPDLILLDVNQIAVYLGDGTGVFTLKGNPYPFQGQFNNNNPEVKVADFNLDGIPDLAVATDNGSGNVTAFLGNGDGTFQSALTSEIANNAAVNHLGREPQAMATGDFNNDGIPDLLVLAQTASGYDLFPMIGQGDGTFAIGSVSPLLAPGPPAGNEPFLTAGDFNGDGFVDVAYLDTSNNLWVALGSGSGVFSYATTSFGQQPSGFATGDFNGDGKLDLAAILGGQVAVLYGTGQGTFNTLATARKFSVCGGAKSMVASDYNGDGRSDFALACGGNGFAQAYLGQGLSLGPLNPASTVAGAGVSEPFTLTITAPNSNFAAGDVVSWLPAGSTTAQTLVPSTISAATLRVTISGSPNDVLLANQGTAAVSVTDPTAAVTSNSQTFTIGPPPAISAITPLTAAVGGTSAPITIAGSNLAQGDTLNFQPPGSALITGIATNFANGALTATLPQSALTAMGAGSVIVVDGSSGVPSTSGFPFNIVAAPALTTLNPTTAGAGSQSFSLTINGTGFVSGDTVSWKPAGAAAQPLSGAVVNGSGTQITVAVPTILLAAVGTANVTVADPDGAASTPAGGLSFSIAAPSISVLNPASVGTLSAATIMAGSGGFTLSVNGSNFIPGTTVNNAYTGSVVLFTDSVGTQHTLTPTASTASQLQVTVPNSYIGSAIASLAVAVQNPGLGVNFSGGAVSTAVQLPVAAPVISNVNPPAETTVPAGSSSPVLTVNGSNFVATSVLAWCNLCNGSPTVLTPASTPTTNQFSVSIPTNNPNLLAATGTVQIWVANDPANLTGLSTNSSPATNLQIASLAVSTLSPSSALAGGPAFSLTINGVNQNFNGGAEVLFGNGLAPISPASSGGSISGGSITVIVPASYIALPGALSIQVQNPGGAISAPISFPVEQLSISNVVPSPLVAGSAALNLDIQGTSFSPSTSIVWTSGVTATTLTPTYNSPTDLSAVATQALLAQAATVEVTASVNVQGVNIVSAPFTVSIVGPVIGIPTPSSSVVNGGAFPLQVNGSNFLNGSTVRWTDGTGATTSLITSYVSATQLTALVTASLLTSAGTALITVVNPAPSGSTGAVSNAQVFAVGPTPTINTNNGLSVCPGGINCTPSSSVTAAAASFLLKVTGTNYQSGSIVVWNVSGAANDLVTQFTDANDLEATVPANLLTTVGSALITVLNPGNAVSNGIIFNVTAGATPVVTTVLPANGVTVGSAAFELTVSCANFANGAQVNWTSGGTTTGLSTVVQDAQTLIAVVPANLVTAVGTAFLTVVSAGATSNSVAFSINPVPAVTLSSLAETSVAAGSATFTLGLVGTNFNSGSVVQWNAGSGVQALATIFTGPTTLSALVPATLLTASETAFINVANSGGALSNSLPFTIGAASGPSITANGLSPASAIAGSGAFELIVNGQNFVAGSQVEWSSGASPQALPTVFVSASELTVVVPASVVAAAGTAFFNVVNPGGLSSGITPFVIGSATGPTLGSLVQTSVAAGSAAFTLGLVGTNFTSSSVVQWNAGAGVQALATIFTGPTTLSALVPATLLTASETAFINVANSGGALSNSLPFTIGAASGPSITANGLSPASAVAGAGAFELIVNGQNFVSGSQVEWNFGATPQALPTVFVSASELTVVVPASAVAAAGTAFVSVVNPGGLSSGLASFLIASPTGPTIVTPGGLSPASVVAAGAAFQLSVTGSNFVNGSTVEWAAGGTPTALTTAFISGSQLTALVPAALIATTGTVFVSVSNPSGTASNLVSFTISAVPGPTIASTNGLNPSFAATGSAALSMTVTGANFVNGSVVQWNTSGTPTPLTTGFVSATQLTALVPASLLVAPATALVVVVNPNMTVSNNMAFSVTGPTPLGAPTLTSITPASAAAGSGSLQLTVAGTNFAAATTTAAGSVVQWDGTSLVTTFVSSTQLTAQVTSSLLQTPGTNFVAVLNGNISSSGATFQVSGPSVTSMSPATVAAGVASFNLVVTGSNFVSGSSVVWSGAALATVFNSVNQVTAQVPANLVATAGSAFVLVSNPGGSTSSPLIFTISVPPPGAISGLSPASAVAGSAAFQLFVTGAGFVSGSTVVWNGSPLPTGFVSATQVTALVGATLIALPGSANVAVQNPGAPVSATVTFPINGPTIASLAPATANAGDPAFTLTVAGTNFVPGTAIQWNGAMLPTAYSSTTQVQASVSAALVVSPATISVTAQNPGGATSPAQSFIVGQPALSIITSTLPDGVVGTLYSQTLAAQGGNQPYAWTITAGTLPGGVSFNAASGTMSGTPTGAASVTLSVTVTDSLGRTAVKPLSLQVYLALTFTTLANLPAATAGTAYSQILAAAGGSPPYLWSVAGNLPPGLTLNVATGQISGLPLAPGGYTFTINVTDSRQEQNASQAFTATVTVASLTIGGLAASAAPAQQIPVTVNIGSPSTVNLSGSLTLTFTSQVGGDDPSIQFSTGGRTVAYTIPAGSTTAVFPQNSQLLLTTGTVAGTILIKASLQAGSTDITPSPAPQATTAVAELAPVITSVTLQPTTGGVTVTIAGYATSKQVTQAALLFNPAPGSSLTASTITVPLTAVITAWYQSASAASFGGQFTVSIPVNVAGNVAAIGSVTVTLTNAQGNSAAATATLH